MKYIILTLAALAVSIAVSVIITRLLTGKKKPKPVFRAIIVIILAVVLIFAFAMIYLSLYYRADEDALKYLKSTENVTVTKTDTAWFFDGEGRDKALIFYPGGKVEETAYAPVLNKLAEKGVDCFLIKMPFRMAVFGANKADDIIRAYDYDEFFIAGHSLGGSMAAGYALSHPDDLTGVIMLASYPTGKLDDSMKYLSIYGSNDCVLEKDTYEKSKSDWPMNAKELIIEGANHSQFGRYGLQRGDGEALISCDEQEDRTVEAILDLVS